MCRLPRMTGNGSVKRIDAYRCRPSNYIHFRAARTIDDDCNRLCFIYKRVHNERATLAGRRERSEDAAAATAQQCYLSPERPVRRHHHFIHNLINTQVSSDKSARTRTGAHAHTRTHMIHLEFMMGMAESACSGFNDTTQPGRWWWR